MNSYPKSLLKFSDAPDVSLSINDVPSNFFAFPVKYEGNYWDYTTSFSSYNTPPTLSPLVKSVIYPYSSIDEAKNGFTNARSVDSQKIDLISASVGEESYGYVYRSPDSVVVFRNKNLVVRIEYRSLEINDALKYANIVNEKINKK